MRNRAISMAATAALALLALLTLGAGTGPQISLSTSTIDFGEQLVDTLTLRTVVLTNTGGSDLVLGELSVDHADFSVGGPSGGIPPGTVVAPAAQLDVPVYFRPTSAGPISATLSIPSNDPATPVATVALLGVGLTDPPILLVSPDSLFEVVEYGDTTPIVRDVTLTNAGDVTLDFEILVLPASGSVPRAARGTGSLDGVRVLWDRTHGQNTWLGNHDDIVAELQSLGATVEELLPAGGGDQITPAVLAGHNVFWSTDMQSNLTTGEKTALADWVHAGGSFLLTGDANARLAAYNQILASLAAHMRLVEIGGSAASDVITTNIPGRFSGHPTCANVDRIYIGLNARTLDTLTTAADSLVKDPNGRHLAAAEEVVAGKVVVIGDETFENVAVQENADNLRFGRQVFEWFASSRWVTVDIASGSIARDSSQVIRLTLDVAELPAGEQELNVRILSNDPVTPAFDLPVHASVEGVPLIEISPTSFSFGTVPVLTSVDTTLVIRNLGSEPLDVQGMNTTSTPFRLSFPDLQIAGGGADTIDVVFLPAQFGIVSGVATLVSNSGGLPEPDSLGVPWNGTGSVNCQLDCVAPSLRPASVGASHGYRFWLDFTLAGNPAPFTSFEFQVEYDLNLLAFTDTVPEFVRVGDLTPGFAPTAFENEPGRITVGGAGLSAVPAGATGTIASLYFEVDCSLCTPGVTGDVTVGELQDGLVGVSPCCGTITIEACPSGDGDVNADDVLNVTDALCALKIAVLSYPDLPSDPACLASGDCEYAQADANCSGDPDPDVTPGDGLVIWEHLACDVAPTPIPCLGGVPLDSDCLGPEPSPGPRAAPALRWGTARAGADGITVFTLEAGEGGARAWGADVRYDETVWEWLGAERGEGAVGWVGFESSPARDGRVRLGAFDAAGIDPGAELARFTLRRRANVTAGRASARGEAPDALHLERVRDVVLVGPAAIRGPAASLPAPVAGLERVGPVPAAGRVGITYGVVADRATVDLTVHDVSGRRVRTLAAGAHGRGRYEVVWDGRDAAGGRVAAGIYFVRLSIDGEGWTRKLAIVK